MDVNSYLIGPNVQYCQELRLIMNEVEIFDLHQFLTEAEKQGMDLPEVAKLLKTELWYMLLETREFNQYLKEEHRP